MPTPAIAHSWNIYTNARYLYQICYPDDLLVPQKKADDGDGLAFKSDSGVILRV